MAKHKTNRIYSSVRQPKKENLNNYLFLAHQSKKRSAEEFLKQMRVQIKNTTPNKEYLIYELTIYTYVQEKIIAEAQPEFLITPSNLSF